MNTIVDLILLSVGSLMLLLVPVALIVGAWASLSVARLPHLENNQDDAEAPAQVVVPMPKAESNDERRATSRTSAWRNS